MLLETDDDDDEVDEAESKPIDAYKRYMTEVVSLMIASLEPQVNLEKALPHIRAATKIVVDVTKVIYKVSYSATHLELFQNYNLTRLPAHSLLKMPKI